MTLQASIGVHYDQLLIGGEWRTPRAPAVIPVIDPATGHTCAQIALGGADDVDLAVSAAERAGEVWRHSGPAERALLLRTIAQGIGENRERFAAVISSEMGAPIDNALTTQTDLAVAVFESYAQVVEEFAWEETVGHSLVVHDPIGVVGTITPWNYPLYLTAVKVAAALAAGCTVVHKPSVEAPLDGFLLAATIEDAARRTGAPSGLLNLVTGHGSQVGEALTRHPRIAAVSLTGSTDAGRRVAAAAADSIKRVSLELGGKSAALITDDVSDLRAAVSGALSDVFYNSGQTCTSCSRILVPATRYEEVVALAVEITSEWTIGDPSRPGPHLGPIATRGQYITIADYIRIGQEEGASLVAGGICPDDQVPTGFEHGHWVLPTVFANVTPDMRIASEEIFGPVAVLIAYEDDGDAVRIANDSEYGLSGAVWCDDQERAVSLARRLDTGRVVLNGAAFNVHAPTGGYKQSGNGRELGEHGLREYLEVKSIQGGAGDSHDTPEACRADLRRVSTDQIPVV